MSKINKRFNVELKVEFEISFSDIVKAEEFFIDGDWRDTFYDYDDLEDLVDSLGLDFYTSRTTVSTDGNYKKIRFVEGYGDFIYDPSIGEWECSDDDFGVISIQDMELETDYVSQL